MPKPGQPFSQENTSVTEPRMQSASMLDGVVIFPDGSVTWTVDNADLKDADLKDAATQGLRSSEAPTEQRFSQPSSSHRHYHLYCEHRIRLGSGRTGLLALAIAVGAALTLLLPWYIYPLWAREQGSGAKST